MDRETLKTIRKIQFKMEHLATDFLAGMYRSAFKGRGVEFQEVRLFQSGDEMRTIDWNVTARMGTPYVKKFQEERELTVFLIVDVSASTRFGSVNALKSRILSEIGAVLAFSGIKNQDKIGLLLFTDIVEHYLPPAKGIKHVFRLIRDLIAFPTKSKGTDLLQALHYFGHVQKKRSVVFLLSDFLNAINYGHAVAILGKTHDLIAISIQDPRESAFPNVGLLALKDLETDATAYIDTSTPEINHVLQKTTAKQKEEAQKIIEKSGGSWVDISTARPYMYDLQKFFKNRAKIKK